jgi:hypothetical protein
VHEFKFGLVLKQRITGVASPLLLLVLRHQLLV